MTKEDLDPAAAAALAIEELEEDMNSSLHDKSCFEEEYDEIEDSMQTLFKELYENVPGLQFDRAGILKKKGVFESSRITKASLSSWLEKACEVLHYSRRTMRRANVSLGKMKNEKIEDKEAIIRLQGEVMKKQSSELAAVQDSLKTEIRSYSETVKKNSSAAPAMTTKQLKSAVREAVKEEDRSRNVMVFGLEEESGEDLEEKIAGVMGDLGEKPQLLSCKRLGAAASETKKPVKVTLRSSDAVRQVLSNASKLKKVPERKSVYLCPDRTPEEREFYSKLNLEMKQKIKQNPQQYFFIRNRTICQVNRRPPEE